MQSESMNEEAVASAKIEFLLHPDNSARLEAICLDRRDDLALSSDPVFRSLSLVHRITLLEQRKLRTKALRKCPDAMGMVFTPIGLEQLTHSELSRYKAGRLPRGLASLADLGCGLGGDSLFLPSFLKVVGVDRSAAAIAAYRHNVGRARGRGDPLRGASEAVLAVRGDVTLLPVRAEAALLDPARRRAGSSNRWDEGDLSPGWDAIETLIDGFAGMALKLGPGSTPPSFLEGHEWEYLGLHDECLELTVWTGALGRPGMVRATELPEGAFIEASRDEIPDSFGRVESPGAYLFEPVKAVVRSHLFGMLAARHGLWQIDPRIAYLSGNESVKSPLLKAYKVIKELPYDVKVIKEFLRSQEVGRLEVKKRGLNLVPEEFRATLRLAGPNQGTLIFTKVMEKKTAFWTQPVDHKGEA